MRRAQRHLEYHVATVTNDERAIAVHVPAVASARALTCAMLSMISCMLVALSVNVILLLGRRIQA